AHRANVTSAWATEHAGSLVRPGPDTSSILNWGSSGAPPQGLPLGAHRERRGGAEYPLFRRDAHVRVRRFRSGTPSRQSDVDEPIHAAMPPLVPRAFSAVSCRSHSLRNFDDRRVWRDSAADSLNGL